MCTRHGDQFHLRRYHRSPSDSTAVCLRPVGLLQLFRDELDPSLCAHLCASVCDESAHFVSKLRVQLAFTLCSTTRAGQAHRIFLRFPGYGFTLTSSVIGFLFVCFRSESAAAQHSRRFLITIATAARAAADCDSAIASFWRILLFRTNRKFNWIARSFVSFRKDCACMWTCSTRGLSGHWPCRLSKAEMSLLSSAFCV